MLSIQEKLLQGHNTVTVDMTMDRFVFKLFAPKVGDTFITENGMKVSVIETTYYEDAKLCIVRLKRV